MNKIPYIALVVILAALSAGCTSSVPTSINSGGGVIVFYSDRDGNTEIYSSKPDGSGTGRLTNDPGYDDSPAISPDGRRVVFLSTRDDPNSRFPDLVYEIYVMDIDGAALERLTFSEASEDHPSWSPSGDSILFDADYDGDGFSEIYSMDPDGTNINRLTSNQANDQFAEWSPDGSQIAFSSDRNGNWDIYVMNADGSNEQPLTDSPDWELFPAWSPDGAQIAYFGKSPNTHNTDVSVMDRDGSNARQLTVMPGFDEDPDWSTDGSQLIFQTDRDGDFEIYVMNPDGSNQHPLAAARQSNELWPSWGPEPSSSH
jgi:TolB protein